MSVREEDRRKNSCSNRGLALGAAAAVGVGVGAALYYFFSKRPENPDTEGSTSGNWSCEQPQTLIITPASDKSEYTTISEHTTTDTSVWLTDDSNNSRRKQINRKTAKRHHSESNSTTSSMDSSYEDYDQSCCGCCYDSSEPETEDECTITDTDSEDSEDESEDSLEEEEDDQSNSSDSNMEPEYDSSLETGYMTLRTTSSHSINDRMHESSDSEVDNEWDVTTSSQYVPTDTSSGSSPYFLNFISRLTSPRLRNNIPRDRRWSLEECAICFEVMLQDQPLMQLPCTHNFHVSCIGPWLREQQTCPMCRKAAE